MRNLAILVLVLTVHSACFANTQLKNICRIKGQEENELRGLGLVIGLNGTGEAGDGQTMRALARAMEIMGSPLAINGQGGQRAIEELRSVKNAALVMVSATVPATGARRVDKLDCFVSAINGKSLEGGRLAFASLMGPNINDERVYGLCQGQVVVENIDQPMVGVIHAGCQMEADVFTKFYKADEGTITLVLEKNHANFQTARDISNRLQEKFWPDADERDVKPGDPHVVEALDAANIKIKIPPHYLAYPVDFAAAVLEVPIQQPEPEARVTINPRAGSVVISGNVEIGEVAVTHRNIVIESTVGPAFQGLSTETPDLPKLQTMLTQLEALKVSTDDMIEIIRGIEKTGKLHGRLIIE